MRVPVNPQTRVPQGQLGYGQNHDVSSGVRALGQVVSAYAQQLEEDNKKKELFDVQRLLVEETNALQLDFDERTKSQPLGAPDFTPTINNDYTARHNEMIEGLRGRFSDDALNELSTRLGTIRSQYVAKAIDYQDRSAFAKTVNDTQDMAISLSQYVTQNPNAVTSALEEMRVALSNTNLDAVEQQRIYEHNEQVILQGAREGFVLQNPEAVLQAYGFPDENRTETNVETGELVNLGQAQKTVSDTFASAGFNNNVIAGFLGNFHVEGGYTGARGDGGKARGIAQWHPDRLANFERAIGKPFDQATIADQAKFAVWEMQNPKAAGMTVAQRDAILKADSPQKAAELIDKYYERSSGEHRQKRIDAAVQFVGAHADRTTTALTGETPAATLFDERGKTGIPALDLATGPQRLQMLTYARSIMNARSADALARQKAAHDEWFNSFLNQLQDGKLGQADLNQAYAEGKIVDFDDRKKAQDILDAKNKKDDDLARFGIMLRSGVQFNPYDKEAQAAVDAGFAKAIEIDAKAGGVGTPNHDPAGPFHIALRTWQRTGVLPTQGGVMIRGGLIGTNPAQVAAAASVASNMLKQNPNAFAGVDGEEDIGKAAANYAHYVDDLGMTAQEAAQKIATQNSPEFQLKVRADEPTRNAFIKKMKESNIQSLANKAAGGGGAFAAYFGGTRGQFASAPQQAEAHQTFTEIALDHYDRYHDEAAAQAYATRQMGRLYGIEGGRLMKYPPSKAYPEVMGSRDYVLEQATSFVKDYVGFDIPKEDVFLQPTASGSTAAAFRSGRPAPYEVHYITRKDDQVIYHHIPGKVFLADVDEAKRAAGKKAREVEQRYRKTGGRKMPGVGTDL